MPNILTEGGGGRSVGLARQQRGALPLLLLCPSMHHFTHSTALQGILITLLASIYLPIYLSVRPWRLFASRPSLNRHHCWCYCYCYCLYREKRSLLLQLEAQLTRTLSCRNRRLFVPFLRKCHRTLLCPCHHSLYLPPDHHRIPRHRRLYHTDRRITATGSRCHAFLSA